MKKLVLASALVASFTIVSPLANAGGIPVIDVGNITQAVIQVGKMQSQIQNQISQITQLDNQIQAMTGNRNMGLILNNPALTKYLTQDQIDLYKAAKNGNLSTELLGRISGIKADEVAALAGGDGKNRFENTQYMNKATMVQAMQQQHARLDNIKQLMQRINVANDPKAAADLSNRIAAENAIIQAEGNRINLMMQLNKANLELAREHRKAAFKKKWVR